MIFHLPNMKMTRIGIGSDFTNVDGSLNQTSSYKVNSKPSNGVWFAPSNEWLKKLNSDWQERLVNRSFQEYEFNGKLFHQDQFNNQYWTKNDKGSIMIDFDKIRNEGYDGIICNNPNAQFFDFWEIESIVIWSGFDNLILLKEEKIPYPLEHGAYLLKAHIQDAFEEKYQVDNSSFSLSANRDNEYKNFLNDIFGSKYIYSNYITNTEWPQIQESLAKSYLLIKQVFCNHMNISLDQFSENHDLDKDYNYYYELKNDFDRKSSIVFTYNTEIISDKLSYKFSLVFKSPDDTIILSSHEDNVFQKVLSDETMTDLINTALSQLFIYNK